jgi:hypothetical protein
MISTMGFQVEKGPPRGLFFVRLPLLFTLGKVLL